MRIRTKLNGFLLLLSVFPIFLIAFVLLKTSEKALIDQVGAHYTTAAELKKQELDLWAEDLKAEFAFITSQIQGDFGVYKYYSNEGELSEDEYEVHKKEEGDIEAKLSSIVKRRLLFSSIVVIEGHTGSVHLSSDEANVDRIYKNEAFFLEGRKSQYLQGISFSQSLGDSTMWISAPIFLENLEEKWVFAAQINLQALATIMGNFSGLGDTGETYLVNPFNQLVGRSRAFPDREFISVHSEGAKDCLLGNDGQGRYLDYRDVEVIGVYRWIQPLNLCLMAEIDENEVFIPLVRLRNLVYLIALAISIIVFIFSVQFARRFTKPINKLTEVAEDISGGNLKKRISRKMIGRHDEVAVLAKAFDKMSNKLSDSLLDIQNIVRAMPGALFILDAKGVITMSNKTSAKFLGRNEDQLKGKEFFDLFYLADKRQSFSFKDLASKKTIHDFSGFLRPKKGKKIPVSLSGVMVEKRKAEEIYILIALDLRGQKKYAHSRVKEITPILNRISLGDFEARLDFPRGNDEFSDLIVAIDLMADNLRQLIKENRQKTEQLQSSHAVLKKAQLETENEKAKAVALLSHIGECVLAIDMNGKVIFINPESERVFGKKSTTVLGENYLEHYRFENENGSEVKPDSYPISDCIKKRKPIHTTTYFITGKHTRIPLSTTASPIIMGKKLIGVVGSFRDITKEKEIDQAKSEFVSLASHQMRTPLTGVKWLIQAAMMEGKATDRQEEFLEDANTSNERMISLVNDLLNISRLEAGVVGVVAEKVEVASFVEQLIKESRFVAKEKRQRIEFKKPTRKLIASLDKHLISEVIISLLSNAMRYSPNGKLITVELSSDRSNIEIRVADQGIGISPKDQKKMFTRFFRSDEAAKIDTTGSGLGLYIVGKVLNVCGGTIKCKSRVGHGATFIVSLPKKGVTRKGSKSLVGRIS